MARRLERRKEEQCKCELLVALQYQTLNAPYYHGASKLLVPRERRKLTVL